MNIDKEELKRKYKENDMEYVFSKALEIAGYILVRQFSIYDKELVEDFKQECVENLWKKVIKGKIDPNNNVFSFIWQNSYYRIMEILRKEKNRKRIAKFYPYDEVEGSYTMDIIDWNSGVGNRYNEAFVT